MELIAKWWRRAARNEFLALAVAVNPDKLPAMKKLTLEEKKEIARKYWSDFLSNFKYTFAGVVHVGRIRDIDIFDFKLKEKGAMLLLGSTRYGISDDGEEIGLPFSEWSRCEWVQ